MKNLLKNKKGFTIIEVMIVLAIAGVIMLVIFLAVPALQRSQRNTQRKADAAHISGVISEYQANNGGASPTAVASTTQPASPTAGTLYLGGEKLSRLVPGNWSLATTVPATLPTTLDNGYIYTTAICSNNAPTATGASANSAVVYFVVETAGSTTGQCIQSS